MIDVTLHNISHYPHYHRLTIKTVFLHTLVRGCGGEFRIAARGIDFTSHEYQKAKRNATNELQRLGLVTPEEGERLYPIVRL